MNSKSIKPIYSTIAEVKKEVTRISFEENAEELSIALRALRSDMAACGWLLPTVTISLISLIDSIPPGAIPEEQQALFVTERLLTPRPDLAAFWQSLPLRPTIQDGGCAP